MFCNKLTSQSIFFHDQHCWSSLLNNSYFNQFIVFYKNEISDKRQAAEKSLQKRSAYSFAIKRLQMPICVNIVDRFLAPFTHHFVINIRLCYTSWNLEANELRQVLPDRGIV